MEHLDFKKAFYFPFKRKVAMLNILWILIPIFGWLALIGYNIKLIQGFIKGNYNELPKFKFIDNLKLAFFMILKILPFIITYTIVSFLLSYLELISGLITLLIDLFIVPILLINFINKETIKSSFEFSILNIVFENLGDYIITMIKGILLMIIYIFMILIIVGIPALAFTQNIFLANFYSRHILSKDIKLVKKVTKESTSIKEEKTNSKNKENDN